ncbi:MAG: amidohydrolase family protein [Jatrophihabitans sp.]|uniref:amidohydrolase family protein n=1 Tax=Jatrophihabitans sp. TaxID=1932789 RepID=UPI003911EAF6
MREQRVASAPWTLATEQLRVRLAAFLGCAPDEVLQARDEAARDWPAYVRRLFDDAGIEGMLLDGGPEPLGPSALDGYATVAGRPMWSLLRIEAVIDPMLADGADGAAIEDALSAAVSEAAAQGVAGLKTVLAYRTGLAVDPTVSRHDAYRDLDASLPVRRQGKALRDYLFRRTLAQCADLLLPIQIHTGFGDDELRLAEADPILLDDVLRTPEGSAAKVVLIHGSFPWHEKLAYLTLVRRNVFAEYSLANLFSPATTAERILQLLDLAPADRILFGTDGHGAPESHWFAATVLFSAWEDVRRALAGSVRAEWIGDVQRAVFGGNARRIYRLTGANLPR